MVERALVARPEDPHIIDSMGWAYYLLGKYREAEEYVEKAVDMMPSDPIVNDHLGDIFWRQGRTTEARFQWERSLTFSPEEKLAEEIRKKLEHGLAAQDNIAGKPPVIASGQPAGKSLP